jgi:hypothetical protein
VDPLLLQTVLRDPSRVENLSEKEWDLLLQQARPSNLLGRVAAAAETAAWRGVPAGPRRHLQAAAIVVDKLQRDVRFELDRVHTILGGAVDPIILLKGAAYLAAGLPPNRGRLFTDIDILVPENRIGGVESLLNMAGWRTGAIDPYDDRYYRRWTHQIPPLSNGQATIDVHHTIVPRTARSGAIDPGKLYERIRRLPEHPGYAILGPEDMVLHSAVHLLNQGEFERGLRDLDDLNLLLRHFGRDKGFWPLLQARAEELGLGRVLFYLLRYTGRILGTPLPPEIVAASENHAPPAPLRALMDAVFLAALAPNHFSARRPMTKPALFALYIRSHYLRMPLHLLIPHLVRKAVQRPHEEPEPQGV